MESASRPCQNSDLTEHGVEGAEKFMAGSWFYGFSPGMTCPMRQASLEFTPKAR